MTDRSIICTGSTVRALRADTKSQTRRLLYSERHVKGGGAIPVDAKFDIRYRPPTIDFSRHPMGTYWTLSGWQAVKPGDRLWVKENMFRDPQTGAVFYAADDAPVSGLEWRWKRHGLSSLYLPRELSRFTLEVTGTKIERVCAISDQDALAEGVITYRDGWDNKQALEAFLCGTEAAVETNYGTMAQRLFYLLWTRLHGRESWTDDPWVVAISFKVHKTNIGTMPEGIAA